MSGGHLAIKKEGLDPGCSSEEGEYGGVGNPSVSTRRVLGNINPRVCQACVKARMEKEHLVKCIILWLVY